MTNLIIAAALDIAITIILYMIWHKKFMEHSDQRSRILHQVIAGLLFGASAIFATETAIDIGGAAINIRDAAPLCAGLIFGGPAGIIAGLIGGLERAIAVSWGAGDYTVVACTLSTCIAGFFAAVLRKFIFESKIPSVLYGLFSGIVMETIHMLMVFLTHMDDIQRAFVIVKKCTLPMIVINSVAVMLAIMAIKYLSNGYAEKHQLRKISQSFQRALMACIVIVFLMSSLFINATQTSLAEKNASALLLTNVEDVKQDVSNASWDVTYAAANRHVGNTGYVLIADEDSTIVSDKCKGQSLSDIDIDLSGKDSDETLSGSVNGIASRYMFAESGGYTIIAVIPEEEVAGTGDLSIYMNIFIEILIFAALFILIYYLIRKLIVENIQKINSSLSQITNGDLDTTVDVRSNMEFASLSDDINTTVVTLKKYIAEASARIDKELEFAKDIQNSSLPSITEPMANDRRFDVYADMIAAKEVGGDFYDYYYLGDRLFVITVADVSGKGIPAAMFMMRAKATLKGLAEEGLGIEDIFAKANSQLCDGNDSGMFVTAWVGMIDLSTGLMRSASAGHNPPVLIKANGDTSFYRFKAGFVLAGMDDMRYKENELVLEPGDKLFLYTDGVTEATDKADALYGDDRLLSVSVDNAALSPAELCGIIKEDIDAFVGEAPQFDDITMLCFKYDGERNDTISLPALVSNISAVTDFAEERLAEAGFSEKAISRIDIVIDELVSNIANYAYTPDTGQVDVTVTTRRDPLTATIVFSDSGIEYDPLDRPDPDITLSGEDRRKGGLGIFMVKNMMDDVRYERRDGRNILTITKKAD